MAFVGDRILSMSVCLLLSKLNQTLGEWDITYQSITSNKSMAKNFVGAETKLLSADIDWNRSTYIEASIYLDFEKFGLDFIREGVKRIPFQKKVNYETRERIYHIMPRNLTSRQAYTFNEGFRLVSDFSN